MTIEQYLKDVKARANAATEGPWKWNAYEFGPQLEGNIKMPDMSPVLVARGCGNEHKSALGIKGCMAQDCKDDPMRACPLHPRKNNRDFIAHSRTDIPRLLRIAEAATEQRKSHWQAIGGEGCRCSLCTAFRELEKTLATDPPAE